MSSTVTFRYDMSRTEDGPKSKRLIKENITDGEKGLSIMFLKKEGDDFYKIYVKENKDSKEYVGTEKKDEVEKDVSMSESEFNKMVNANKHLNFVKEYMENVKSGNKGKQSSSLEKKSEKSSSKKTNSKKTKGGAKKPSKKVSKKVSKKSSKKKSKKLSGGAKKSSKKATKKTSKKVTKKKSKKMSGGGKKTSDGDNEKKSKKLSSSKNTTSTH